MSGLEERPTVKAGGHPRYGELVGEKEVIERIIEMRKNGWGTPRIAKELDREGVKPRNSETWHVSSVQVILGRIEP